MAGIPCEAPRIAGSRSAPSSRQDLAAVVVLAIGAGVNMRAWFAQDLMPPGDFPGYASVIQQVRDWLLRYGRVPSWCSECFGGSTYFVSSLKEVLAFPLVLWVEPVLATKLLFLIMKLLAALGLYAVVKRASGSASAGIIAGYAFGFGACANHESEHLDVWISSLLLALALLASAELLRRRESGWALALGVAAACQLANNWVQAALVPLVFSLLLTFRPWRQRPGDENPLADSRLATRWLALAALALGVFLAFGASQLAWLAADANHHRPYPLEVTAEGQKLFIERSPFLFVNRDNWLASWLAEHYPPNLDVAKLDGGRRYLGLVALAVCIGGWFPARRSYALRRWYQVGGLLFLAQYWLSLGSMTLLWEVSESLHWGAQVEGRLRTALTLGAASCLLGALWAMDRRRRRLANAPPPERIELLLGAALLLFFPAHSLWSAAAWAVPLIKAQRSPGHFFDLAPFSLYLVFGLGLAALLRRIPRPPVARAVACGVGLLVVLDFWPSRAVFSQGEPMGPLRETRDMLASLPGEAGTLRLAMLPWVTPLQSWAAMQSRAGHAWGWLAWQSGTHWLHYMTAATWRLADSNSAGEEPESGALSYRRLPRKFSNPLLRIGRLRYYLLESATRELPRPWRRIASDGRFSVFEQPRVVPMATGYGAYVLAMDGSEPADPSLVARAFHRNLLVVSEAGPLARHAELVEAAKLVLCRSDSALADEPSRELAARHAGKLFPPGARERAWTTRLSRVSANRARALAYRRPAPERIVVETGGAADLAMVFVSEAHHPWWRATVDGEPAPVLRAQMTFMAVPVRPGSRVIDLRLDPPWFVPVADRVSATAWVALGAGVPCVAVLRWRRRQRPLREPTR